MLACVLMRLGRHAEGGEEFSRLLAAEPAAGDYYYRGLCRQELGDSAGAGADSAAAADHEPSNPVFSNKHLVFLAVNGARESVASRIESEMRIGIRSNMAAWVVAAALLAFQDGRPDAAQNLLHEAALIFSPWELATLTRDPAFEPFLGPRTAPLAE